MKTPLQHFSTRRLASWQSEWEFLQRSLAREPEAPQAWWWKLRLRVLAFVITRYGADPAVRARDHALTSCGSSGDLTFGERRTVEPRPRAALSTHLQSIAEANDFPRPPAPRDDDDDQARRKRFEVEYIFAAVFVASASTVMATAIAFKDDPHALLVSVAFLVLCGFLLFTLNPFLNLIARWVSRK